MKNLFSSESPFKETKFNCFMQQRFSNLDVVCSDEDPPPEEELDPLPPPPPPPPPPPSNGG